MGRWLPSYVERVRMTRAYMRNLTPMQRWEMMQRAREELRLKGIYVTDEQAAAHVERLLGREEGQDD